MSLCDFWAKTTDSGRILRPVTRSDPSGSEISAPDNMADGDEVDNLVTKISEGVFSEVSVPAWILNSTRLPNQWARSGINRWSCKARNMGEITVFGNHIHYFADFSPVVDKKRREFLEAKKSFWALGIPYRMTFPATLRIAHDNKVQLFKTPA